MNLRAVLDTNVMVSGVLWRGIPFELLKWSEDGRLVVFASLEILAEVHRVLHHPKFQQYIDDTKITAQDLFLKIASLCTIIQVEKLFENVCPDKDDDKFLSCAIAAGVDVLISGDKHLLDLNRFQSIRILTARQFYEENIIKLTGC